MGFISTYLGKVCSLACHAEHDVMLRPMLSSTLLFLTATIFFKKKKEEMYS